MFIFTRQAAIFVAMTRNIQTIKLVDPIVQSLLFVLFAYSLDGGNYVTPMLLIMAWVVVSSAVHVFLDFSRKKIVERAINFILVVIFLAVWFLTRNNKEHFIETIGGDGPMEVPIRQTIMVSLGIAIAFWYYVICFREVRYIIKKRSKKNI